MSEPQHPCPCCGHRTLMTAGRYDLCAVCFWEDDPNQLERPLSEDGANGKSLVDSQRCYQRIGAMDEIFIRKVRRARTNERLDDRWRPLEPQRDLDGAGAQTAGSRAEYASLYWWR
ncbi:CPCC family cysteine-rich protein [Microlunatus soli]|uniref:Cysteine-rich CPCC n=1 Tax=Microlunatus soli TaxID=630515 RepID=A0A1H1NKP0_9ACTN|nr:CPCC family cysteine-rich protein [Microlunatus soli]SDR99552.1 Cysteine-rich CPCC [Microlunatus soli]